MSNPVFPPTQTQTTSQNPFPIESDAQIDASTPTFKPPIAVFSTSSITIITILVIIVAGTTGYLFFSRLIPFKSRSSVQLDPSVLSPTTTQSQPTLAAQLYQPPSDPTPSPTKLSMIDFPDRELLDETSTHRLYLANPVEIDNTSRTGSLLLENNIDQTVQILADNYKAYFSVILIDDRSDEYIVLSSGSGTQRAGEVFSLSKNQSVGNKFCTSSGLVIYQDYLIYGNCDIQLNRPWGAGEASSVVIQNLSTGDEQVIAQSDVLHQYSPVKVANNILYYSESSVTNEEDWNDRSLLKSQQLEHDLNLLTI